MRRQPGSRADRQLAQSFDALGVRPGASERDVEAAYSAKRSKLAALEGPQATAQRKLLERALRLIKVNQQFAGSGKARSVVPAPPGNDGYERSLKLLGLAPGATDREVDAAINVARGTVTDPVKLRELHRAASIARSRRRTKRRRPSERHLGRFLIVASLVLVTLAIFTGFQVATRFRHHFVQFEPGDTVYRVEDGRPFGVVMAFEESHRFPNGAARDAYHVSLHPDSKHAWISARTAQTALTQKRP